MSRDDNHRTAPTAMNRQEIRLFVFTKAGVYEYDAKANKLIKKADGDKRELMASNGGNAGFKQDFVLNAPVSLLMVIDYDKFGSSDEKATMMCCVDAGNISENINLYCQAVGLATVPRATHDTNSIKALLGLTDKQLPIMNNPVGYAK
jgi:nitroreductase